jgi:hypothetical protein
MNITFVNHDAGTNHRALKFNHDCWLLLLGYPLDYWNNENLEATISSFGRMLIWERDDKYLGKLIIKAKVTSLEDVPNFIVVTDGDAFHGESWTMQCEIIQQYMLGVLPQDEDMVVVNNDHPDPPNPPFDFFSFGQVAPARTHFNEHDNDLGNLLNKQC